MADNQEKKGLGTRHSEVSNPYSKKKIEEDNKQINMAMELQDAIQYFIRAMRIIEEEVKKIIVQIDQFNEEQRRAVAEDFGKLLAAFAQLEREMQERLMAMERERIKAELSSPEKILAGLNAELSVLYGNRTQFNQNVVNAVADALQLGLPQQPIKLHVNIDPALLKDKGFNGDIDFTFEGLGLAKAMEDFADALESGASKLLDLFSFDKIEKFVRQAIEIEFDEKLPFGINQVVDLSLPGGEKAAQDCAHKFKESKAFKDNVDKVMDQVRENVLANPEGMAGIRGAIEGWRANEDEIVKKENEMQMIISRISSGKAFLIENPQPSSERTSSRKKLDKFKSLSDSGISTASNKPPILPVRAGNPSSSTASPDPDMDSMLSNALRNKSNK